LINDYFFYFTPFQAFFQKETPPLPGKPMGQKRDGYLTNEGDVVALTGRLLNVVPGLSAYPVRAMGISQPSRATLLAFETRGHFNQNIFRVCLLRAAGSCLAGRYRI
jgi:hypothetical protein